MQSGQRIVMFSYGSGLTSTMFSFKLNEGQHPFSLTNIASVLDVTAKLESRHVVWFFILTTLSQSVVDRKRILSYILQRCIKLDQKHNFFIPMWYGLPSYMALEFVTSVLKINFLRFYTKL